MNNKYLHRLVSADAILDSFVRVDFLRTHDQQVYRALYGSSIMGRDSYHERFSLCSVTHSESDDSVGVGVTVRVVNILRQNEREEEARTEVIRLKK